MDFLAPPDVSLEHVAGSDPFLEMDPINYVQVGTTNMVEPVPNGPVLICVWGDP